MSTNQGTDSTREAFESFFPAAWLQRDAEQMNDHATAALGPIAEQLNILMASRVEILDGATVVGYEIKTGALHAMVGFLGGKVMIPTGVASRQAGAIAAPEPPAPQPVEFQPGAPGFDGGNAWYAAVQAIETGWPLRRTRAAQAAIGAPPDSSVHQSQTVASGPEAVDERPSVLTPPPHPESQIMRWSALELAAILAYGERCWCAGRSCK